MFSMFYSFLQSPSQVFIDEEHVQKYPFAYIVEDASNEDTMITTIRFRNLSYKYSTPIEAFQAYFYLFYALNMKYSATLEQCFLLIQKGLFKVNDHDDQKFLTIPFFDLLKRFN